MCRFWKECVEAISQGFGISKTKATLIVLAMTTSILAMIAQTWFIWAGLIGTAVTVLALLRITEWSLRLYYWIHDWGRPPRQTCERISNKKPALPAMLPSPCSDVQGRIAVTALDNRDASSMAESILRHATVRKVSIPGWLRFPAICRACPSLAHAGRVLMAVIAG